MITVTIHINERILKRVSARRIKLEDGVGVYRVDEGSEEVRHFYDEGAVVLAKKLLDLEPRENTLPDMLKIIKRLKDL
jgi:hypothetical protein